MFVLSLNPTRLGFFLSIPSLGNATAPNTTGTVRIIESLVVITEYVTSSPIVITRSGNPFLPASLSMRRASSISSLWFHFSQSR